MDNNLIVQAIGLVAVLLSIAIFQMNRRSTMLKLGTLAGVLYSVHFYLLGATTGSAMNLVGAGRSYVYSRTTPSRNKLWIPFIFASVGITATVLTWQGPLSLLALFGSVSGGMAAWHTKPKYIRRWALIAPPLWFTYNAVSGSYPGMLIEVIMITSNLVGEYRFDWKHVHHARLRHARPI